MEIKAGRKYKRVKMSGHPDRECFIGQVVTVFNVDRDRVYFEKVWKDGKIDRGGSQSLVRFSENFKPPVISLENK